MAQISPPALRAIMYLEARVGGTGEDTEALAQAYARGAQAVIDKVEAYGGELDYERVAVDMRDMCVLCLRSMQHSATWLQVVNRTGADIVYADPFMSQTFKNSTSSDGGSLKRRLASLIDFVRMVGRGNVLYEVNGELVRILADVDVYGMPVCASHIDSAITLWQSGRPQSWR